MMLGKKFTVLCVLTVAMAKKAVVTEPTEQVLTKVDYAFWFETQANNTKYIPQCANWSITTLANPNRKKEPTAPFYVQVIAGGYPVQAVQVSTGAPPTTGYWTANYPPGTNLTLAMIDSQGSTGGSADGYMMVQGNNTWGDNSCVTASAITNVSFNAFPEDNPCDQIGFTIDGGVPPYSVTIVNPLGVNMENLTAIENSSVLLTNPSPAGTPYSVFVTDSTGSSSLAKSMTSGLGQTGCSAVNMTALMASASNIAGLKASSSGSGNHQSSHAGAIAGGTVGGVVGVALIAAVIFLLMRRRQATANATMAEKSQPLESVDVTPGFAAEPWDQTPASSPAATESTRKSGIGMYAGAAEPQYGGYAAFVGQGTPSASLQPGYDASSYPASSPSVNSEHFDRLATPGAPSPPPPAAGYTTYTAADLDDPALFTPRR